MSFTYDNSLSTDKDWVRFLAGDTVEASAALSDEEIAALLAEETATGAAKKYFTAASALGSLMRRWASAGGGLIEKEVSRLKLRFGIEQSAAAALEARIRELREEGAYRQTRSTHVLRVVGSRRRGVV